SDVCSSDLPVVGAPPDVPGAPGTVVTGAGAVVVGEASGDPSSSPKPSPRNATTPRRVPASTTMMAGPTRSFISLLQTRDLDFGLRAARGLLGEHRPPVGGDEGRDHARLECPVGVDEHAGHGRRGAVGGDARPDEVAEPPEHRRPVDDLQRVEPVLMVAEYDIGSGLDHCPGVGDV